MKDSCCAQPRHNQGLDEIRRPDVASLGFCDGFIGREAMTVDA
jgi:hypothetical protein